MKLLRLDWEQVPPDGRQPVCSGVTLAVSTNREMSCSLAASWWRVLVLDDGAEVPKALCDKHRPDEEQKWAAEPASIWVDGVVTEGAVREVMVE